MDTLAWELQHEDGTTILRAHAEDMTLTHTNHVSNDSTTKFSTQQVRFSF